jgi:hypothetical protein
MQRTDDIAARYSVQTRYERSQVLKFGGFGVVQSRSNTCQGDH